MFSPPQKIGLDGELWVHHQLELLGYKPTMKPLFNEMCCDLVIDGLPVEVKLSKPGARWKVLSDGIFQGYPRWQWNVSAVNTADRVLILVAQDGQGVNYPFILPGAIMAHRDNFEINTHPARYKGILAGYLNNWAVVDFMLKKRYLDGGQLTLEMAACV